jgi:Rrf2 family protein
MLALTAKSKYGVEAVLELAHAWGGGLVQIRDIVARAHIPKNYLEQIFNRLGKQGIVHSVRGSRGGYALAEHPAHITLLQVLEALEGEIELSRQSRLDAVREVLDKAQRDVREALSVTIADLLARQQVLKNQPMYYI